MFFNKKAKGFTLIELLVVIAIIGILSSVVLASLNSARGKGEAARTKAQLSQVRVQAELSYDDAANNDYDEVCADVQDLLIGLPGTNPEDNCADDAAAYAAWGQISNDTALVADWFCVDSTGYSASPVTIKAAGDVDCQ
ncbi:MAG: prepilin-type N-terminal cleavage/methylation domain-containing protein [Candidatus Paceibacteria bacterium]|jgi:prepilin-type N-terminal cleavage/methylation domain-containing protein